MDDIVCAICGESWSIDYSTEDVPETYEREGGHVYGCSMCRKVKRKPGREKQADGSIKNQIHSESNHGYAILDVDHAFDSADGLDQATQSGTRAARSQTAKRGHALMTAEVRQRLPKLFATENVKNPVVQVKYFSPWNGWTWYATEFDGKDIFFGLVDGFFAEWGYFSLSELEAVEGPCGVPAIERDLHFRPASISEVTDGKHRKE